MKANIYTCAIAIAAIVAGVSSCKKPSVTVNEYRYDTTGTLKAAAEFPVGAAIDYDVMKADLRYSEIVKQEFDNVSFGYLMKHAGVVKDNGSYDFSKTDELVNICTAAGLEVFGHTLNWHQNNNGNYLRSLLSLPGAGSGANPNLLLNGTFEAGAGNSFTNWAAYNGGSSFSAGSGAAEVRTGTRSLKVSVATNSPGQQWKVQLASDNFATTTGTSYRVSYWIKAASTGGAMRVSTQGGGDNYQGDVATATAWTQVTWDFPAKSANTKILFDMGAVANTYFIDDVTVTLTNPPTAVATEAEKRARIDSAMRDFITTMVTRYKDKVKAWDVVNEPVDDNGQLRKDPVSVSDWFYWGAYYDGDNFIRKAFEYAHAADPNALLFLNDYNQEVSTKKLDSLVAIVTRLKQSGVPIHGVGMQLHIGINTSNAGIDRALLKMGRTGLKVRISELDVKLNPGQEVNFVVTPTMLIQQAEKYKFVVLSYLRNIPPAQRHGITVWGVNDANSWLVTPAFLEYPLLWDREYKKKQAYYQFLSGLQAK